ncbi:tRNA-dihydrouridine(47) synthase [NAD(P)(+)]-like protein [Coemansia spiralis]|uniref:tRNA-dihydrouridine(47) synthase [NAD(P)(+)] n=2 Tax=Coemansia TaxID=4863 RepID=A0A9W8FZD7_9FUNG|nr:tRNA-dihydrouridine(47) synthase [NAD(P)(+)]-like protein [Coemansia umbellata]KAJ2620150.1 tRNA-dihydrouridine(47) synthase [NAD(P)(+)]-like protein [Coemansia sp. RSA 1358]KAJ2672671.1 tRNA-dihydrouridine(47) synthase [NAD(P)(+)]-like protein [Coemansia spiralis]
MSIQESDSTSDLKKGDALVKKKYLVLKDETEDSNDPPVQEKLKRQGGQHHARGSKNKQPREFQCNRLCHKLSIGKECSFGDSCTFSHDVEGYLAQKEPDLGPTCHLFETFGTCKHGLRCRYANAHKVELVDKDKIEPEQNLLNDFGRDMQIRLRKKQVSFPRYAEFEETLKAEPAQQGSSKTDADEREEKRQKKSRGCLDYQGKTYLAPLTTVGNLPFRRICKGFGVDITCSEMAIAGNLLQGQQSEWALLKRHPSETIFGIQLAGNRADVIGKAAELISNECSVDFIDLNMGCPIDMAFNNGGGSALLSQPKKIERMIRAMRYVSDCDITVKFRTGVKTGVNVAHTLVPEFAKWGAAIGTLHGRSRQQRYTKLADWKYIGQCHKNSPSAMAFFGGGDVLSWEDYWEHMEHEKRCDGIMIGRGALIKPWVFKEIEERRVWDISATERLDMLKQFAKYGMEHWGTDTQGIANVRRYMLEWQSFLCRYIPAGILEVLPQKMNDRPPAYVGRNDLETLMASDKVKDWIKLSEMILGPAPDGFTFVPKHKSNSYEG